MHGLQAPGRTRALRRSFARSRPRAEGEGFGTVYPPLFVTAAIVVALDQVTKTLALAALKTDAIDIVPGVLRLRLAFNSGAAFGLLPGVPGLFVIGSLVVAVLIVFWARRVRERGWVIPLGMVLGGGLGNAADRVFRGYGGQVVDFIDLHVWPVFNLADTAIVLGAAFVLIRGARDSAPDDANTGPRPSR